ncbi:uncharacterized protein LOC131037267 [Cryptomeria japonica]|uniref:uncharacterized protein LOC131037267 n=1 Tax=Cryptomeria japonica TaxID=3369 RepID=UPI0025AB8976|nr:uncharacterized protein LOC131037267 [Cryptomeria japonica]
MIYPDMITMGHSNDSGNRKIVSASSSTELSRDNGYEEVDQQGQDREEQEAETARDDDREEHSNGVDGEMDNNKDDWTDGYDYDDEEGDSGMEDDDEQEEEEDECYITGISLDETEHGISFASEPIVE